ncbi:MAG: DNA/RNA nuclease SfsA [Aquificae bacterium]|nr:DNA/RNA nuclease SfsA [Aquificota bacterium]
MPLFDLQKLGKIEEGIFIDRPNRFVGLCQIDKKVVKCHIADPGRLKELLTKNRKIFAVKNPKGYKTDYKLVAVESDKEIILLNTSIHSKIGYEAIKNGVLGFYPEKIKKEVTFGKSRIDYLINDKIFVELKGCNLKSEAKCLFPDAPTKRGEKHLKELIEAVNKGYQAYILILILRECTCFSPNFKLDKNFSNTFVKALSRGVKFRAFKIKIKNFKIFLEKEIPLCENILQKRKS